MDKGLVKCQKIEKQHLKIDRNNLESQFIKIHEVLLKISKNYRFDTFSHFAKLADISTKENIDPGQAIELLESWDYDSLDFINNGKSCNCVDFAILCQKMLADVGVPTSIIGRFPEEKDYTKKQGDFLKYRHVTPMYANESNDLKVYVLEPSWKYSNPVPVITGTPSIYKDWKSEISQINGSQFTQIAYNEQKAKSRERLFDIHPLNVDFCHQLNKRFIRVPRELKILNTKNEDEIQFIKFDPNRQIFFSNIVGVDKEFIPNTISLEQTSLLEETLQKPELSKYLSKVYYFIKSLPSDFWIKD